jgi:hypothetical protein
MTKKELEIATTTYTVAYKKGYTQCQEDMAKELDNLKGQLREWCVIYQGFIKDKDGISSLSLLEFIKVNYNPPTKKKD